MPNFMDTHNNLPLARQAREALKLTPEEATAWYSYFVGSISCVVSEAQMRRAIENANECVLEARTRVEVMRTCDCPIVFPEDPSLTGQVHRYDCPLAEKGSSHES